MMEILIMWYLFVGAVVALVAIGSLQLIVKSNIFENDKRQLAEEILNNKNILAKTFVSIFLMWPMLVTKFVVESAVGIIKMRKENRL